VERAVKHWTTPAYYLAAPDDPYVADVCSPHANGRHIQYSCGQCGKIWVTTNASDEALLPAFCTTCMRHLTGGDFVTPYALPSPALPAPIPATHLEAWILMDPSREALRQQLLHTRVHLEEARKLMRFKPRALHVTPQPLHAYTPSTDGHLERQNQFIKAAMTQTFPQNPSCEAAGGVIRVSEDIPFTQPVPRYSSRLTDSHIHIYSDDEEPQAPRPSPKIMRFMSQGSSPALRISSPGPAEASGPAK
jgi:hypothetical protein